MNALGPLSVLLSTTAVSGSSSHSDILGKVRDLARRVGNGQLSLHLLHVKTHNSSTANTYLNLARLFAPTTRVVLFPALIECLPPHDLHNLVYLQNSSLPALVTTPSRATYPFSELSPIFLRRNYSVWCTERYLMPNGHLAGWQECIWQIWMGSLGQAERIRISDIPGERSKMTRKSDKVRLADSLVGWLSIRPDPTPAKLKFPVRVL